MTVELREEAAGKNLVVRASGKLSKQDYERFVPEVERLIKAHGKLRIGDDFVTSGSTTILLGVSPGVGETVRVNYVRA